MKKQLTVGQYRAMDLFFFALMMAVSESVIVLAATRWFPNEPYTVSVVAAVVAIVLCLALVLSLVAGLLAY